MRILKIAFAGLVTLLAMFASLVVAFIVALVGLLAYVFIRLRGKSARRPFGGPRPMPPRRPADDVIDVTVTEVGTKQLDR